MSDSTSCRKQSILLIDDDELIAGSLRGYLVMSGCVVDVALDESEAGRMMTAGRYDVIVVDPYFTGGIHHPDGDVIDLIGRLQPDAALVILTAYCSPRLAQDAAGRNVAALLSKPQSVMTLSGLVMNLSRSQESLAAPGSAS